MLEHVTGSIADLEYLAVEHLSVSEKVCKQFARGAFRFVMRGLQIGQIRSIRIADQPVVRAYVKEEQGHSIG